MINFQRITNLISINTLCFFFFNISAVMVKYHDQKQMMEERVRLGLWLQRDMTLLWKGGSRIMSDTADIMGRWETISSTTNKSRESDLEVGQGYELSKPSPHWWCTLSNKAASPTSIPNCVISWAPTIQIFVPAGEQTLFKPPQYLASLIIILK